MASDSQADSQGAVTCIYCRRRIYRQRNGAWYHARNGSTSCYPGDGSWKRATPCNLATAGRRDGGR